MNIQKNVDRWKSIFLCFFVALALGIRMEMPQEAWMMSGMEEIVCNLSVSMHNYVFLSLLYGVVVYADQAVERLKQHRHPFYGIAGFAVAVCWLMGEGFRIDNSFNELSATAGQMIKGSVYLIGHTYLLTQLLYLLEWLIYRYSRPLCAQTQSRNTYTKAFVLLLIGWAPHWLLAYPGNTCFDSLYQFRQFFGLDPFTAHHPPVHTLLIGWMVKLGELLGKAEWGLYANALVQTVLAAAILAYAYLTLIRLHAPKWLKGFFFLVSFVSPYYTAYIGTVLKDVPYSYGFLLYMIELVYILMLGQTYFQSRKHVLLLCLSTMMVYLLRNNGAYVLWGSTAALVGFLLLKKSEPQRIKAVSFIVLPLVLSMGISSLVAELYHVGPGGIQESLSLPIQQTARYVKEHPDDVTPEEREAIDAVLQYDRLADMYNPIISDTAKGLMGEINPSNEEVLTYLKTWARQAIRHPFTYVQATLNQNYFLLYPFDPNPAVYLSTGTVECGDFSVAAPEQIIPVKEKMKMVYQLLFSLPVTGLISNPAFYVLLLMALCIYALHRKDHSFWILLWPELLSVVAVVLAPAIFKHPRYLFPVIYSMPLLVSYAIHLGRRA